MQKLRRPLHANSFSAKRDCGRSRHYRGILIRLKVERPRARSPKVIDRDLEACAGNIPAISSGMICGSVRVRAAYLYSVFGRATRKKGHGFDTTRWRIAKSLITITSSGSRVFFGRDGVCPADSIERSLGARTWRDVDQIVIKNLP